MKRKIGVHRQKCHRYEHLSRIERHVLRHIERYRLTTRRGWSGAWELSDFEPMRLSRAVRRLHAWGLLTRGTLFGSIHYFQLSHAGASLLHLPQARGRPLSAVARYRAIAHLLFATTGRAPRLLVTASEFLAQFGPVGVESRAGLPSGFFAEGGNCSRLTFLEVDRARGGPARRSAHRLRQTLLRLANHPFLGTMVRDGHLGLAVITPETRRGEVIQHRMETYRGLPRVPFVVMVAPGLAPLARPTNV